MELSGLEKVLFENDGITVISDVTAERGACYYRYTNEPYSLDTYAKIVDSGTVLGIIGGGEQLLSYARNQKVKKIIGIDMNTSQVALLLAKICWCYDNEKEGLRKKLFEVADTLWNDYIELEKRLEKYLDGTVKVYNFEKIYENLKERLKRQDIEITAIAGDALKIFPYLWPYFDDVTIYLSNLPDIVDHHALFISLEGFIKKGCPIVISDIESDYYIGRGKEFINLVLDRTNYHYKKIDTYTKGNWVFNEYVYVLKPCFIIFST